MTSLWKIASIISRGGARGRSRSRAQSTTRNNSPRQKYLQLSILSMQFRQREEENDFTKEHSKARLLTLIERFPCRKAEGDKGASRSLVAPHMQGWGSRISSNVAQKKALNEDTVKCSLLTSSVIPHQTQSQGSSVRLHEPHVPSSTWPWTTSTCTSSSFVTSLCSLCCFLTGSGVRAT